MDSAKYTISVPRGGKDLAHAAHQYVLHGQVIRGVHDAQVHRRVEGLHGPSDHLVVIGQETPEFDSHLKQVAAYIGDAGNHESIPVTKEGKSGIEAWHIPNLNYKAAA